MKVLMFSLDPNVLHAARGTGKRMDDYASLTEHLNIVLFSTGGTRHDRGNLTIYPTSRNRLASFVKGLVLGFYILSRERHDLITIQEPFAPSLVGFPLAWLFRLPIQVQVHSTFFSPYWKESIKNTIYQMIARFFVPRATCVRVVSKRIQEDLSDLNVPEQKLSVLPIFTDARRIVDAKPNFDLHQKYPQFDFIALIASRLVKQKNVELAVDAMEILATRHPRMGLVIVGAGSHEHALKDRCTERGLEDSVVFEGWSDDVASYLKSADVFLLTSNYEGWAMSVIEAMAARIAVIMTDVGCAGEVVQDGENGIVIPIGGQTELETAIERLYVNPEERKRLAEAGQKTVLSLKPQTWEEYLSLYKKEWERCISLYRQEKR